MYTLVHENVHNSLEEHQEERKKKIIIELN